MQQTSRHSATLRYLLPSCTQRAPRLAGASVLLLIVALSSSSKSLGHGSIVVPLSRVAQCRFADDPENPTGPACSAAIDLAGTSQFLYDWNGIRQGDAAGAHRSVVPDGQLCSGGGTEFSGLDLARNDWVATTITPDPNGHYEFVYQATAPHDTLEMLFFVTHDGWDPLVPLAWSDLDADPTGTPDLIEPFCRLTDVTLESDPLLPDPIYRMTCPLPQRAGRHVIYNVWQRSDSAEAFYACVDVIFAPPAALFTDSFESGDTGAWSR